MSHPTYTNFTKYTSAYAMSIIRKCLNDPYGLVCVYRFLGHRMGTTYDGSQSVYKFLIIFYS